MTTFLDKDFLLSNQTARRLYHQYASPQPILDYHCHLSPQDIAENRRFRNLYEIWLEGDHYKWRAMRACGVSERLITGEKSGHQHDGTTVAARHSGAVKDGVARQAGELQPPSRLGQRPAHPAVADRVGAKNEAIGSLNVGAVFGRLS